MVIGEVQVKLQAHSDGRLLPQPHARQLSYFSRLLPADEFTRLAVVETHRRGVRAARAVAGVMDGASWLQGLLDYHRPDAVRILDQPHALDHLHSLAQAVWDSNSNSNSCGTDVAMEGWREAKQILNEQEPDVMSAALEPLAEGAQDREGSAKHRDYLEGRREQMRYKQFREAGWPVGSGIVESGNKVVVERRLKGAGKRWAVEHMNPVLALRSELCSGRWAQAWEAGARGDGARSRQGERHNEHNEHDDGGRNRTDGADGRQHTDAASRARGWATAGRGGGHIGAAMHKVGAAAISQPCSSANASPRAMATSS